MEGCLPPAQNSPFDGFYHSREPPANGTRTTTRKTFRITNSCLGTDGKAIVYPFWGGCKFVELNGT